MEDLYDVLSEMEFKANGVREMRFLNFGGVTVYNGVCRHSYITRECLICDEDDRW